jgi:hypothetical protein
LHVLQGLQGAKAKSSTKFLHEGRITKISLSNLVFPAGFLANLDTGSDEPEGLTHVILGKCQLAVPHTIQILIWRHFVQFPPIGNCHMGSCWNDSRVSGHEYHHKPHVSQLEEAFWPLFFFDPISWLFNLDSSCSDLVSLILPGETAAANSQSKCCSSN